jgi:hypothetical protein
MDQDVALASPCDIFNEDYYLRGPQTGVSNYENYRWVGHLTLPMASAMKKWLGVEEGDTLMDIGTARGYLVKAFRMLNIQAYGYDVSKWAIENCDPDVKEFVSTELMCEPMSYDFICMKDCGEHIEYEQLTKIIPRLIKGTRKAMLVIVPLAGESGGKYICPKDEMDATHKIRWTLPEWLNFLQSFDRRMVVSGSYYIPGIKEANTAWENSCGFFTIKRF